MSTLTIAAQDSTTMIGRELKHTLRFPLMLTALILVPAVFLPLFVSILGGPIGDGLGAAGRGAPYVDFLVPGILMMTVAAGCGITAINVCTDMTGGIIDRPCMGDEAAFERLVARLRGAAARGAHSNANPARSSASTATASA